MQWVYFASVLYTLLQGVFWIGYFRSRARLGFDRCTRMFMWWTHTCFWETQSPSFTTRLIVASWGHHMTHLWKIAWGIFVCLTRKSTKMIMWIVNIQWTFLTETLWGCCAGFVQVMLICFISHQSNGAAFLLRIKSHKTQKVTARWMCFWHARVFCQFCATDNS